MSDIQEYLYRIVRRSGLTRSEQSEWISEMSTHLTEEVEHLKEKGYQDTEAIQQALDQFGDRREIRKHIARKTFGVSLGLISVLSACFFILFLMGVYLLYASIPSTPDISTMSSWHENPWVSLFTTRIPISPSLMLALCLDTLILVKTRCRRDRWALFLITSVFGALWVLMRSSHHYYIAGLLIPGWGATGAPLGISDILVFCLSVGTYLFTKNKSVSRFPIILSLAIGLWVPARNYVQYHLWMATHWNGFWGHEPPDLYGLLVMVGIQLVTLWLLKYVFGAIDNFNSRKSLTT